MTIFINKGDLPLTDYQLEKRSQAHILMEWLPQDREKSIRKEDNKFNEFMQQFSESHKTNVANNLFNLQLANYKSAIQRLSRYKLSEGQEALYEDVPTGEFDEEGNELFENILIQPQIDPLQVTIEVPVFNEETGEQMGTEEIPNPLIVQDEKERSDAQEVVDDTPNEVKDWLS